MTHIAELMLCYESAMDARGGRALPLVVNTHGWVRDLGFDLLQQIVGIVRRSAKRRRGGGGGAAFASRRTRRLFVMQMELHAQTRNLPRRRWWADGYEDHCDEDDDDRSTGLRGDETHILIRPVRSEQSESETNDAYNSAEARLWHYSAFAQACKRRAEKNTGEVDAMEASSSGSRSAAVHRLASVPPYCISAEDVKV